MLEINLNNTTSNLIVTLDLSVIENPGFMLLLNNKYTKRGFQITLGEDISIDKSRYNEFVLVTESLPDLDEEDYYYEIYEYSGIFSKEDSNLLEQGLLFVTPVANNDDEFISIESNPSDDDVIVYSE